MIVDGVILDGHCSESDSESLEPFGRYPQPYSTCIISSAGAPPNLRVWDRPSPNGALGTERGSRTIPLLDPEPLLSSRSPNIAAMSHHEREILERAVRAVSEQAAKADELVDEAIAAGLDGSHPVTIHAKMLRLELLK